MFVTENIQDDEMLKSQKTDYEVTVSASVDDTLTVSYIDLVLYTLIVSYIDLVLYTLTVSYIDLVFCSHTLTVSYIGTGSCHSVGTCLEYFQEYRVKWKEPTSLSSSNVVAHRVYYKEYGLETVIGHKDVPLHKQEVLIIG